MKSYVINLDRSPERLAAITEQFQAQGLELTRIAAVDGNFIDADMYQKLTHGQNYLHLLTKGEVACVLSHRLVWQKIVEDSAPYAAIFEDDALLSSHANRLLTQWDWIPPDADIVKIETQRKKVWLGAPQKLDSTFSIARLKSTHMCTGAYIISRKMAQQLLQKTENITLPVDDLLFGFEYNFAHQINIYQLEPALVMQSDIPSTLETARQELRRRTVLRVIKRETKRMCKKTCRGLRGLWINLFTQGTWKRIPFDDVK